MEKRTSIKIIKRRDAVARVDVKTRNSDEPKIAAASEEKIERSLHRKMADTVSNWITERRENKRSEEISAFRSLFGDEMVSGRAA